MVGDRSVFLGLDRVAEKKILMDKKIVLVANQASLSSDLCPILDRVMALRGRGAVLAILSPEHGYYGSAMDGEKNPHSKDEYTGINVFSLYGETCKPTDEMLEGADAIVYDIQDVGLRFYTYITTMKFCIEAAAEKGLEFIVLDRPNPINGLQVEGPMLEEELKSFVGSLQIPIRYGLTPGELAKLINSEHAYGADLDVVEMIGWERRMWFKDTDLSWMPPSPNMPTAETALIYAGICLFEGTNLSEGRGTSAPFRYIGAPWIDEKRFAKELNELRLPGLKFTPVRFKPLDSKYAGELCRGVYLHLLDNEAFKPFETAVRMLEYITREYEEHFRWRKVNSGRHYIDLLVGTDELRKSLEKNSVSEMLEKTKTESETFRELAKGYWIYGNEH
ncbi:MAG: exo-beta-N-acetylmuramidase NamZ family protein [Thermoproteota archaeon]